MGLLSRTTQSKKQWAKLSKGDQIVLVPVEKIDPNPAQPRKVFHMEELETLSKSIEQSGLIQPILLRPVWKTDAELRYELVAGERRLQAFKLLNRQQIPAIIQEMSDNRSAELALIENIERSDLTFFEEAEAIRGLMERWNFTQEQTAARLGKSQSYIANKLRLLRFSPTIREQILQGGLTERHARALLRLEDVRQLETAVAAVTEHQYTVAMTEHYVAQLLEGALKPQAKAGTTRVVVKDLRIFLNTINRAMDTMKLAGIEATTQTREDDQFIEYVVKIPKQSAYKNKK